MPLGNEDPRDRAGTGIEVLVGAPGREVGCPVVELELDVADGVREIEPDRDATPAAELADGGHVEHLPAVVLDAGQEQQRNTVTVFIEQGLEVLEIEPLVVPGSPVDHAFRGVEAVHTHLARRRVAIRRECLGLDDDLVALGCGPVKASHQDVQIHGERVHGRDFVRLCASERHETVHATLVIAGPGSF